MAQEAAVKFVFVVVGSLRKMHLKLLYTMKKPQTLNLWKGGDLEKQRLFTSS